MKDLKQHWAISKFGNSRFKDNDRHPIIDLISVKEVTYIVDVICILICVLCVFYFNITLLMSLGIASAVHILIALTLSITSTIMERSWRRRLDVKRAFSLTLNRFALNKERKVKHKGKHCLY